MDQINQPRRNLQFKQERLRRRWTQVEVATKIDMQPDTIGKWERGVDTPSLYALEKLCKLFGKSAAELGFEHVTEVPVAYEEPRPLSKKERPFPPIWNVPHDENPLFTWREQILKQLHDTLLSQDAVVVTQTLSGLGGIGKTHLAIKYCYDYRQEYKAVLWVRADSPELLVSNLLEIAKLLKLPECRLKEQQSVLNGLRRWMREQSRWLLIIDNVEDMDTLRDTLSSARRGHVLITTRTHITGTFPKIALQEMQVDEGALLLLRRTNLLAPQTDPSQISESVRATAKQVSQALGGLPLALDQAGAYMQETGCGFQGYLEEYERKRAELLSYRGNGQSEHPASVATTFYLCFERVKQVSTLAADILRASAFLHPDAIPEEIFLKGWKEWGSSFRDLANESISLNRLMTPLLCYSLLERNSQQKTLRIHSLVQAVLKDAMNQEEQHLWVKRTVAAVDYIFPSDEKTLLEHAHRYLPHVSVCVPIITLGQSVPSEAAHLLSSAGVYEVIGSQYHVGQERLQQALSLYEGISESDPQQIAACLEHLAVAYELQGNATEAEVFYFKALTAYEQLFSPGHPRHRKAIHNLILFYLKLSRLEKARSLLEQIQTAPEEWQETDPEGAVQNAYLQALFYSVGDQLTEAEHFFQKALSLHEQWRGPDHPSQIGMLNSVVLLYMKRGMFLEAEPLCQRILAIAEKQVIPLQQVMISQRSNLATIYQRQGKFGEAVKIYQDALRLQEEVEGLDPLEVARIHNNIGLLYKRQDCFAEAEEHYQQALAIVERDQGREYPEAASFLANLAGLYQKRGEYEKIEALCQRAIVVIEHTLGSDHPEMVYYLNNLAAFYTSQEKYSQAEPLYQQALSIMEKGRGEYPLGLQVVQGYAYLLRETGREAQAKALEESSGS